MDDPRDKPPPDAELPFEEALAQLESAVSALEGGGLGLDAALARYEQGVRLLGRCHTLLDRAERQVALLTGVDPDGTPKTAPFDGAATLRRDATADAD
jgi:exodeoxyribonuclease VII small subunit